MRDITRRQWQRVQATLDSALALPAPERDVFIRQHLADDAALAGEVLRLLAAHQETGPVDRLAAVLHGAGATQGAGDGGDVEPPPVRVGAWQLGALLGRGGMGSVYAAVRADGQYEQRAAIKLLRRDVVDPDVRRRFLAERSILGRIEHDGIARILDGGVTEDGQPWFAMEHVAGAPIDAWCVARRLDVRQRLALFRDVCATVQHAHSHLVVHRDIKPSNIVVTEAGRPKLLDFGIARLLKPGVLPDAGETQTGLVLFTPGFASPEQLRGEAVGTASDVFQLGTLLFTLLVGRPPRRSGTDADDRPPLAERPSAAAGTALRAAVHRDLDRIVEMATHADPRRRYASAGHLSDDVQRWLDGLPVRARPDEFGYRAARFIRRHRGAVAAGTLAVLSLVAFSAFTVAQARQLERERDRARASVAFLTELFQSADPTVVGGAPVTVRQVVDRGAERIRASQDDPLVRSELLAVLASTYRELGERGAALELGRESLALLPAGRRHDVERAAAQRSLARAYAEAGEPDSAQVHAAAAVAIFRRRAPRSRALADAVLNLGAVARLAGNASAAAQHFEEAMALFDASGDTASAGYIMAAGSLALLLRARGEHARADSMGRRALALRSETGRPLDLDTDDHGPAPDDLRAEQVWADAVATYTAQLGAGNPKTADIQISHARALRKVGRLADADSVLRRAVATLETAAPADPRLVRARGDRAEVLWDLGRFADAEPLLLAVHRALAGRTGSDEARTGHLRKLVAFYEAWGRAPESDRYRAMLPPGDSTRR
jgi:eukaryotic-like serine/threonine-protein kinase